jgi:hypothetical protein
MIHTLYHFKFQKRSTQQHSHQNNIQSFSTPLKLKKKYSSCTIANVVGNLGARLEEVVDSKDQVDQAAREECHLQDPSFRNPAHNAQA